MLQRIEFVALDGIAGPGGRRVARQSGDAEGRRRSENAAIGGPGAGGEYLNTEFAGLPLLEVREAVLARLQQERTLYDELLARALRLAQSTLERSAHVSRRFTSKARRRCSTSGHEAVSLATLRALFEMMEEKERMVHLLEPYIDGPGLTVVIGTEHASPDLRRFSLIACTAVDGRTTDGRRHRTRRGCTTRGRSRW